MEQVHGGVVALAGRGLLVLGPAGSGKSTLALQLMAVGAGLVSDDRTDLRRRGADLWASCPPALRGLIEARGVGVLAADAHGPVQIVCAVDLGRGPDDRLPQSQSVHLCGVPVPLVLGPYRPHLYSALRQLLLAGRAR